MSGRPFLYLSLPGVAFILGVFWYRRRNNKRIECAEGGGSGGDIGDSIKKSTQNGQIPNGSIKTSTTTSSTNMTNNKASKSMSINNGKISHHKHGQPDIDDNDGIAIHQFGKSAPINIVPNGNCNGNGMINNKSNAIENAVNNAVLQQNVVDSEVLKLKIQDFEHKILRSIDEDFENLSSPVDLPDSMHHTRGAFYTAARNANINRDEPVIIKATTTPKISPENSFLERNFVKSQEQNNNFDDLTPATKTISATTRALSQSPQEYNNNNSKINNVNSIRRISATNVETTLPVIQETKNEAQQKNDKQQSTDKNIAASHTDVDIDVINSQIITTEVDAIDGITTTTAAALSKSADRKEDAASPSLSLSSEQSGDSGKGSSLPRSEATKSAKTSYEFLFPTRLLGHLYGRKQNFINKLKSKSGANVKLSHEITNELVHNKVSICIVEGTESEINMALNMIRQRMPLRNYPNFTMQRIHYALPQTVVPLSAESLLNLKMNLIEGINNDVVVSAVISGGHIFVQQPLHPTHPTLALLQKGLYDSYSSCETPLLPSIEISAVCVTCVNGIWYRVQIVSADPDDELRCVVRFLDFGGYLNVHFADLRQIRTDFMSMPFQATECMLSNIEPIDCCWTPESADILCKLTKGIVLQAQVAGYTSHNIPEVYLFACLGPNNVIFINKELVARNVAKWVDMSD